MRLSAALLALVALAWADLARKTKANNNNNNYQCRSEGFHVNPADCARFVRCVDQWQSGHLTAFHFSCPAGEYLRELAFEGHSRGWAEIDKRQISWPNLAHCATLTLTLTHKRQFANFDFIAGSPPNGCPTAHLEAPLETVAKI